MKILKKCTSASVLLFKSANKHLLKPALNVIAEEAAQQIQKMKAEARQAEENKNRLEEHKRRQALEVKKEQLRDAIKNKQAMS